MYNSLGLSCSLFCGSVRMSSILIYLLEGVAEDLLLSKYESVEMLRGLVSGSLCFR